MRPASARVVAGVVALVGSLSPVAATAGTTGEGDGRGRADGRLVIGSLVPETGPQATLLDSLRVPVQLAVDEINAAGGVNGAPVSLVTGDEGQSLDVARATFDRMVTTDGVDAVVGPSGSASTLALVRQIARHDVLTCSGSDTAASVTSSSADGYYFRTAPPDRLQAIALAELVLADHRLRVAVLHRDDDYGTSFAAPLEQRVRRGGSKVVRSVGYRANGADLASAVKRVAAAEPDAVVVLGFADDGANAVRAMLAAGLGPSTLGVYAADGLQSTSFSASVDPADPGQVSGIKGTAPAAAPSGTESPFSGALAARNVEPIFSAYYYDCAVLVALAAVRATSDEPAALKHAFAQNLRGRTDCNTFATCKQLLDAGSTIHWRGASSSFDRFRTFEPAQGAYDVWSYDANGAVVTADPSQQIHVG